MHRPALLDEMQCGAGLGLDPGMEKYQYSFGTV